MTSEILTDSAGRPTGVAYYDENDRLQEQPADVVIVACAAVESARSAAQFEAPSAPQRPG